MTLSLVGYKKLIKSRVAVLVLAAILLVPGLASSQSSNRDRNNSNDNDEPATQSGSGIWGNSAGSRVGSADNSGNAAKPAADPRLGPGGGTLARPLGPTPDATGGPGGNPDVPFDTSMNLMFLAGGIVFAYVVYRRKYKLKAVIAEKK